MNSNNIKDELTSASACVEMCAFLRSETGQEYLRRINEAGLVSKKTELHYEIIERIARNMEEISREEALKISRSIAEEADRARELTKDNWQSRSQEMRCQTCMFFIQKLGGIGRCRRHSPTMNGYPAVYSDDWCGDHKIDENKL